MSTGHITFFNIYTFGYDSDNILQVKTQDDVQHELKNQNIHLKNEKEKEKEKKETSTNWKITRDAPPELLNCIRLTGII